MRKPQAFLFAKMEWALTEARKWLAEHGASAAEMEESDTEYRFIQFPRDQVDEGTFQSEAPGPKGLIALTGEVTRIKAQIIGDELDTFTSIDPRVLAMLMKRAEPRAGERLIFLKGFDSVIEKDAAENGRLRFTITTDSEDRMGDVIDPEGWVFRNYEHNPIVLFNHEYGEVAGSPPSQGRTLLIEKYDHGLRAVMEFHRKTKFNEELFSLYRDGYMNTTSVGFWPMDRPEERETKAGGTGLRFKKQDLLEWSLVAVPANADAYQMAMKKGLVRERTAQYLSSILAPYADRPGGDPAHGENRHKAAQERERLDNAGAAASAALASLTFHNRRRGA